MNAELWVLDKLTDGIDHVVNTWTWSTWVMALMMLWCVVYIFVDMEVVIRTKIVNAKGWDPRQWSTGAQLLWAAPVFVRNALCFPQTVKRYGWPSQLWAYHDWSQEELDSPVQLFLKLLW